jgi:hypothetical protein
VTIALNRTEMNEYIVTTVTLNKTVSLNHFTTPCSRADICQSSLVTKEGLSGVATADKNEASKNLFLVVVVILYIIQQFQIKSNTALGEYLIPVSDELNTMLPHCKACLDNVCK